MRMHTRGHHRMATDTSKTTNFRARFFYTVLYLLANLLINITFPYWQVLSFIEDLVQTNVFA